MDNIVTLQPDTSHWKNKKRIKEHSKDMLQVHDNKIFWRATNGHGWIEEIGNQPHKVRKIIRLSGEISHGTGGFPFSQPIGCACIKRYVFVNNENKIIRMLIYGKEQYFWYWTGVPFARGFWGRREYNEDIFQSIIQTHEDLFSRESMENFAKQTNLEFSEIRIKNEKEFKKLINNFENL